LTSQFGRFQGLDNCPATSKFIPSRGRLKRLRIPIFQMFRPGPRIRDGDEFPKRPTFSGVLRGQPAVSRFGCPLIELPPGQTNADVSKKGNVEGVRVEPDNSPSPTRSGSCAPVPGLVP